MSSLSGDGVRAPADPEKPEIDVSAMPRVLRRIGATAARQEPWRVVLAMAASLGAAMASLSLPRLFGGAVNQAQKLLRIAGGGHVAAQAHQAREALLLTAG